MVDRTHREFVKDDIARIADTYHAWRGERGAVEYVDIPGFCASVATAQIAEHRHVLTPGPYVGTEEPDSDGEPLDEKITRLTKELYDVFDESDRLQQRIKSALRNIDVR
jgi:type I restriction enzyme M protein